MNKQMVLPGIEEISNVPNVRKFMKIYSYVVARDFGFAPNPFGKYCTLANCKPRIRHRAQKGDWIVGTGSAENGMTGYLIYAMQVSETMSFDEYWADPRFQYKKPDLHGGNKIAFGDNIYCKNNLGEWQQIDSHHSYANGASNPANIDRDTKYNRILIAERFTYFGDKAVIIPDELRNCHGEDLCKSGPGHKCKFSPDMVREFIGWFSSLNETGQCGNPIDWEAKGEFLS